ncbi:MAG: DUF2163 domain-containing protein [Alphaproteobacteria bacterium]|nr:DUF2163 domain-containing protein [Alphaproteobacteria bacterium]NDC56837.1 DUF2163 domain-containing protein [Alphaproteobacteria bacterium]NDG05173.1 DUF2163 domain-containing protein [Alphaproteobacteria bacterium]
MKTLHAGLATHVLGEVTTLCALLVITRVDGVVLRLTTHDRPLVFSGQTYLSDASFTPSANDSALGLNIDHLDISGILSSEAIEDDDVLSGAYDGARIDYYLANWADTSQTPLQLRRGWLGDVRHENGQYVAELRGLHDGLQHTVGAVMTPECRHRLGDSACGVNLPGLMVTGSVTSFSGQQIFSDTALTEAADYFTGGLITWITGANAGRTSDIGQWNNATKTFTLWLPAPFAIGIGDQYQVTPGCDKRLGTCVSKFSNIANFGGFPHLPGVDQLLDYPSGR